MSGFTKMFGEDRDQVVVMKRQDEYDEPAIYLIFMPGPSELMLTFDSRKSRDEAFDKFDEKLAFEDRDAVRSVHEKM